MPSNYLFTCLTYNDTQSFIINRYISPSLPYYYDSSCYLACYFSQVHDEDWLVNLFKANKCQTGTRNHSLIFKYFNRNSPPPFKLFNYSSNLTTTYSNPFCDTVI